jgi:hypothetical protein
LLLGLFAWLVGFGAATAYLAVRRRRNPVWWAVLGAILGPIAIVILLRAPPGQCANCGARTIGWSTICAWCGENVWGVAATAPATAVVWAAKPRSARAPEPDTEPEISAPMPLTVIEGKRRTPSRAVTELATDTAAHTAAEASPAADADAATAVGPVHRLRAVLGSSPTDGEFASHGAIAADPDLEGRQIVLASAIYVTGTRGLQAGSRYGIALVGTNLAIMGPVDIDPSAIVVLRALRGLDATGAQGQLIVTADDGFRGKFAMVFMALAGGTPERVAGIITTAASGEAMAQ